MPGPRHGPGGHDGRTSERPTSPGAGRPTPAGARIGEHTGPRGRPRADEGRAPDGGRPEEGVSASERPVGPEAFAARHTVSSVSRRAAVAALCPALIRASACRVTRRPSRARRSDPAPSPTDSAPTPTHAARTSGGPVEVLGRAAGARGAASVESVLGRPRSVPARGRGAAVMGPVIGRGGLRRQAEAPRWWCRRYLRRRRAGVAPSRRRASVEKAGRGRRGSQGYPAARGPASTPDEGVRAGARAQRLRRPHPANDPPTLLATLAPREGRGPVPSSKDASTVRRPSSRRSSSRVMSLPSTLRDRPGGGGPSSVSRAGRGTVDRGARWTLACGHHQALKAPKKLMKAKRRAGCRATQKRFEGS